jgi:outer membrane protein
MPNVLPKAAAALSAAWLAGLGCIASFDASGVDIKIGFVSTERVLRESAPAIRSLKKLEREFEKRDGELKRLEQQFRTLQSQLERDGATMSENDRRNRERDLSNLTRDIQRTERSLREDKNQRANEELTNLQERANTIIKQIADQEKFDLILQEPVVWASPRIDITDRVIKLLADK